MRHIPAPGASVDERVGRAVSEDRFAVIRLMRPKQWAKNVLVAAAPGAAGRLDEPDIIWTTAVAFVSFCLASSATYAVNDARDAEVDRLHPSKRRRPIAAGAVSVQLAYGLAALLAAAALTVSLVAGWRLAVVVALYIVLSIGYTYVLKSVAVLDVAVVASGFILRSIAGGAAANVVISDWFLIVASFGALFIVVTKRSSEQRELGELAPAVRRTLASYPGTYLTFVRAVTAAIAMVGYALWAFEKAEAVTHSLPWFELSIAPFVMGMLRYALVSEVRGGGAPEDIVLGDRPLQLITVAWAATFAAGIYLGS